MYFQIIFLLIAYFIDFSMILPWNGPTTRWKEVFYQTHSMGKCKFGEYHSAYIE